MSGHEMWVHYFTLKEKSKTMMPVGRCWCRPFEGRIPGSVLASRDSDDPSSWQGLFQCNLSWNSFDAILLPIHCMAL